MAEPTIHAANRDEARIEISLNRLSQLFNSLDPSPFHERDLDQDAEEYIVSSAEEIGRQRPIALVIHLPADQVPGAGSINLANAIHNYFAYRKAHERRRLRLLFRDGRIALLIGLLAMWRPLEIFLYEWVPIRRRCHVLAKLAAMPVVVQPKSA